MKILLIVVLIFVIMLIAYSYSEQYKDKFDFYNNLKSFLMQFKINLSFKQAKINTNINSLKLSKDQISLLINTIKNLKFEVYDCFDNNQIHSGGVELESLSEELMSNQINNLYFAGEVCDVDGDCGGFNLQWAWTSGYIVGESL